MAVGPWGAVVISICAVLKSIGSLGGWMLLVGQSGKAAADDGMFPRIFAVVNRHGVPSHGLIIVSILMTVMLFATMSPTVAEQFNHIVDLAVIMIVVPYIYSAVAVVKVVHDHEGAGHSNFNNYKFLAVVAVLYCLWAIWGGDPQTVVHAMVALLLSVPLYPFFMRSMAEARQRKQAASSTTN
jgi:arginine:agmatine antiporter